MSRIVGTVVLASIVAACAASRESSIPEPRPLHREIPAVTVGDSPSGEREAREQPPAPTGEITLRDALAAALLGSPDLAAASFETRAAQARALQASLYPNPELEFEVEEFGGDLSGFSAAEMTLALSQEIPLAGKIGKRADVADAETRLAGWDAEAKRLDVLTATTKAFIAVLAAQEQVRLAEDSVKLGEEVARAVGEQADAGKVSPVAAKEANVALSLERLRLARVQREAQAARRDLAAMWGGTNASFTTVRGDLSQTRPVPAAKALEERIGDNPDLARWDDATLLSRDRLESQRAEAWPDLTLTGGVKQSRETDDTSFLAGLTVPLPLFDRNQGGIDEAAADAGRVEEERRAATVRIETDFRRAWADLSFAASAAKMLAKEVLPTASEAFEATREGFRQGKFTYLEVLVAQRTLFTTREQLIDSLSTYHRAVADVERLIGQSLSQVSSKSPTGDDAGEGRQ